MSGRLIFLLWWSSEVDLQRLIYKFGDGGFLIDQYGRQSDVAFEIANLDGHFVALLYHRYLVHLDMGQRQAQDVLIILLDDLLDQATIEDLRRILVAEDDLCQFAQLGDTKNLLRTIGR